MCGINTGCCTPLCFAQNFEKISKFFDVTKSNIMGYFFSNVVAFTEYMNFITQVTLMWRVCVWNKYRVLHTTLLCSKWRCNQRQPEKLTVYKKDKEKSDSLFDTVLVFCYQNCSDLLWEKIVLVIEKNFEAERREFSKILRPLEQFVQTVKGQNNFW